MKYAEQAAPAKELRKLLIDADLNHAEIARRLGIHHTALSQYLNGHRRWPQDFPSRFREAVGL
jgi:transcriptional regulator with XRE-family HTH domain